MFKFYDFLTEEEKAIMNGIARGMNPAKFDKKGLVKAQRNKYASAVSFKHVGKRPSHGNYAPFLQEKKEDK